MITPRERSWAINQRNRAAGGDAVLVDRGRRGVPEQGETGRVEAAEIGAEEDLAALVAIRLVRAGVHDGRGRAFIVRLSWVWPRPLCGSDLETLPSGPAALSAPQPGSSPWRS